VKVTSQFIFKAIHEYQASAYKSNRMVSLSAALQLVITHNGLDVLQ